MKNWQESDGNEMQLNAFSNNFTLDYGLCVWGLCVFVVEETTPKTLTKSGNQSQDRRITHPRPRTFRLGGATNRINSARLYRNPRRRIFTKDAAQDEFW